MLLDASSGAVLADAKLYNEAQSSAAVQAAAVRPHLLASILSGSALFLLYLPKLILSQVPTAQPSTGLNCFHVVWNHVFVSRVQDLAPSGHACVSATSSLAKLLTWHSAELWQKHAAEGVSPVLLHQADWLASLLTGVLPCTLMRCGRNYIGRWQLPSSACILSQPTEYSNRTAELFPIEPVSREPLDKMMHCHGSWYLFTLGSAAVEHCGRSASTRQSAGQSGAVL